MAASMTAGIPSSLSNDSSVASTTGASTTASPHPEISEPALEFLLSSILHWVEAEARRDYARNNNHANAEEETTGEETMTSNSPENKDNKDRTLNNPTPTPQEPLSPQSASEQKAKAAAQQSLIAEHAAAKMERLGYDVGYRLMERIAQSKGLAPPAPTNGNGTNKSTTATVAAHQLEAVKFLCKEFWMTLYQKQIDKLQTNHRGVFVLKDLDFKWLNRLPGEVGIARIMAIKMLAFPCGLIRGALANLNVPSVVSCDFLSDGVNMASCSFNLKIK